MELDFNTATIIDLVLDHVLGFEQLRTISSQMHLHPEKYADLWASEEFVKVLEEELKLMWSLR